MTIYLLDENVLRELRVGGDARVLAWQDSVSDSDLRISVMTLFEKRRGWERRRKSTPALADDRLAELGALEAAYADRIVPVDVAVAAEWARLLGAKDKNQRHRALAATARANNFVLVTRNTEHVRGCGVQVLNPFTSDPAIEIV